MRFRLIASTPTNATTATTTTITLQQRSEEAGLFKPLLRAGRVLPRFQHQSSGGLLEEICAFSTV